MTKRFFYLIFTILILQNSFSQITHSEIKKRKTIAFKAPKPFDSLNNFHKRSISKFDLAEIDKITDYHLKDSLYKKLELNDFKKYIGLDFYLPESDKYVYLCTKNKHSVKNSENIDIYTNYYKPLNICQNRLNRDWKEPQNSYYKIIDVHNSKVIANKIRKDFENIKSKYEEPYGGDYNICFTAVRKNTNDTIYIGYQNLEENFTFVPYFVKMKKLFENKTFLAIEVTKGHDGYFNKAVDETTKKEFIVKPFSKWTCEITLLKDSKNPHKPKFLFKNDDGNIIVYENQHSKQILWEASDRYGFYFITEQEYAEQERLKKINKEQLKKEKANNDNLEKIKHQKFLDKCINNYGSKYGNLIANNEVEIGMTKEMCELSWGKPFDSFVTKTENLIREISYYSYKKSLYFENNILVKIEY